MDALETYLPAPLRALLPQDDPLVTLALTLLAAFLWLRILMLLAGLFRPTPARPPEPPPIPKAPPPRGPGPWD